MKLHLFTIGKEKRDEYSVLCQDFENRISKKIPFVYQNFNNEKSLLKNIKSEDFVVLMDAAAKMPGSSKKFSRLLQNYMNKRQDDVIFIIGGAYGFGAELQKRSNRKLSLSPLTFPHRMARLMLIEQIYRGLSILNNEPYSH